MDDMPMLASPRLAALPGVRHGFFTRQGGVSEGLYASLNVGRGSGDEAERVEENRRRALARLAPEANKSGKADVTRFLPAKRTFGAAGQLPEVAPVPWQGSGDQAAMARSNCFLVLPEDSHHPEPGAIVRILLY